MRLRARTAVSLLSLPGALVERYLFPYLCSFELIYVNSYFYALGTSSPLPYSWHIQQLILSSSGRFVADVSLCVVRTSKGDLVFIDLEQSICWTVEVDPFYINLPSYTYCCYADDLFVIGACEYND